MLANAIFFISSCCFWFCIFSISNCCCDDVGACKFSKGTNVRRCFCKILWVGNADSPSWTLGGTLAAGNGVVFETIVKTIPGCSSVVELDPIILMVDP